MNIPRAIRSTLILAAALALTACGDIRSHADFETLVKDKSTAEVEKKLGKPAAVDESQADKIRWTYTSQTFATSDSGGTKFDKKTIVVFRKPSADAPAKVAEVVYE